MPEVLFLTLNQFFFAGFLWYKKDPEGEYRQSILCAPTIILHLILVLLLFSPVSFLQFRLWLFRWNILAMSFFFFICVLILVREVWIRNIVKGFLSWIVFVYLFSDIGLLGVFANEFLPILSASDPLLAGILFSAFLLIPRRSIRIFYFLIFSISLMAYSHSLPGLWSIDMEKIVAWKVSPPGSFLGAGEIWTESSDGLYIQRTREKETFYDLQWDAIRSWPRSKRQLLQRVSQNMDFPILVQKGEGSSLFLMDPSRSAWGRVESIAWDEQGIPIAYSGPLY